MTGVNAAWAQPESGPVELFDVDVGQPWLESQVEQPWLELGPHVTVLVGVPRPSVAKKPATAIPMIIETAITASATLFKRRHLMEKSCRNHKWVCPNAQKLRYALSRVKYAGQSPCIMGSLRLRRGGLAKNPALVTYRHLRLIFLDVNSRQPRFFFRRLERPISIIFSTHANSSVNHQGLPESRVYHEGLTKLIPSACRPC